MLGRILIFYISSKFYLQMMPFYIDTRLALRLANSKNDPSHGAPGSMTWYPARGYLLINADTSELMYCILSIEVLPTLDEIID